MSDREHRRLRLDPPVGLIDKRTGRKVGEVCSFDVRVDADALVDLLDLRTTLWQEGGHGPEGAGSKTSSVSETAINSAREDERVTALWGYWLTIRKPRRGTMGKGSARQLRRAITAGYSDADIKKAMVALMASDWHAQRNLQTLSAIFATRPGGPTFEDQVDSWIERADNSSIDATSATGGLVNSAKDTVRRTWALRLDSTVAKEHFEDAMRLLAQHDITVTDNNGRPEFS